MDIMTSYFLVVNGKILAFTSILHSVNVLLDLLFAKYNKIDLYDDDTYYVTVTRENVEEYLDCYQGSIKLTGAYFQNESLNILIFDMKYRYDLEESLENDRAILNFLDDETHEKQLRREYENYQLRWMMYHGYSLNDLINKLGEIADEHLYNNGRFSLSENFEKAFEIFQEDNGFEVDFKEDELASFEQWKKGKTNSSLIFPF